MQQAPLNVEVIEDRTGTTVKVTGEFDASNAMTAFSDAADAAIGWRTDVVLDLHDVTFIDASGLQALIILREKVAALGGELVLHPSTIVRRLLEVIGMTGTFGLIDGGETSMSNRHAVTLRS
jgi:anti-anti-sigma factor